ncbi:expressed protein [Phakopsora pachyrhizi]|uniref:Expressed protein n=1 Tax=Phakopsora pachyrhizi TaxID=170000 RepID=A0AAV0AP69_PHAPC|nr:expressed protein [Phakopsora pachyrhizi]
MGTYTNWGIWVQKVAFLMFEIYIPLSKLIYPKKVTFWFPEVNSETPNIYIFLLFFFSYYFDFNYTFSFFKKKSFQKLDLSSPVILNFPSHTNHKSFFFPNQLINH